jgi:hypothetical protein
MFGGSYGAYIEVSFSYKQEALRELKSNIGLLTNGAIGATCL